MRREHLRNGKSLSKTEYMFCLVGLPTLLSSLSTSPFFQNSLSLFSAGPSQNISEVSAGAWLHEEPWVGCLCIPTMRKEARCVIILHTIHSRHSFSFQPRKTPGFLLSVWPWLTETLLLPYRHQRTIMFPRFSSCPNASLDEGVRDVEATEREFFSLPGRRLLCGKVTVKPWRQGKVWSGHEWSLCKAYRSLLHQRNKSESSQIRSKNGTGKRFRADLYSHLGLDDTVYAQHYPEQIPWCLSQIQGFCFVSPTRC